VGAELFHADGQTDMAKLIVAFRNFTNASKSDTLDVTEVLTYEFYDQLYSDVVCL